MVHPVGKHTLTLLDKFNFKVHPNKINLFLAPHASGRRFTWAAGRSVGADSNGNTVFGVDPETTPALTEASTPLHVGELMTFLGACGWLRKHLPEYAKVSSACLEVVELALKGR